MQQLTFAACLRNKGAYKHCFKFTFYCINLVSMQHDANVDFLHLRYTGRPKIKNKSDHFYEA
jgi:hypothetical protein